jgi:hypothetical protein
MIPLVTPPYGTTIEGTGLHPSDFRKLFDPQMVIMTAYHDVGLPDRIPG